MIGLRPWADICLGIGFLVFFVYFLIMMWRRSRRNKSSPNANDLMQKALVETGLSCSQSAYIQQSGNKYSFFVDGALHEKNIHQNNASDTPTRAFNLDKADKEYKGRHYIKAKQAALGEEVRRKIAGLEHKDIHILVEEDQRQKHALKEGREHNDANKDLNGSRSYTSGDSSLSASSVKTGVFVPGSSEMNWGRCYTQKELEMATNSFSDSNVLGYGSDGIVYHGTLPDGTPIVLKNLSNNRGQADKDFKLEVEAVGRVRHKNLVRLSGYCMEGSQRFLVYEYIENGNLEQWLHGTLGKSAPLPWDVRMKIIIGTARGLAYLHEGLEPKVVHRDVKPSNILLDSLWNPKVSDFGFAKLLGPDKRHVTTRVMGTFGYVAPEYVSTGMLTEKSDVYSYGVLVMELITGRVPVDHNRPIGEIHLIEWLKSMVGSRRSEEVADPSMTDRPPPRSLKRALLVALRCVDPDDTKRPTMSHVVHMLESMDDSPSCQEQNQPEVKYCSHLKEDPAAPMKLKHFAISAMTLAQTDDNDDGGFVKIIDAKTTWKYER